MIMVKTVVQTLIRKYALDHFKCRLSNSNAGYLIPATRETRRDQVNWPEKYRPTLDHFKTIYEL
jgi:hypothetical protein